MKRSRQDCVMVSNWEMHACANTITNENSIWSSLISFFIWFAEVESKTRGKNLSRILSWRYIHTTAFSFQAVCCGKFFPCFVRTFFCCSGDLLREDGRRSRRTQLHTCSRARQTLSCRISNLCAFLLARQFFHWTVIKYFIWIEFYRAVPVKFWFFPFWNNKWPAYISGRWTRIKWPNRTRPQRSTRFIIVLWKPLGWNPIFNRLTSFEFDFEKIRWLNFVTEPFPYLRARSLQFLATLVFVSD